MTTDYLKKRMDALMFHTIPLNKDLMSEVFMFDARQLESTTSAKISQYTIGLSSFLVYFQSQVNLTRVKLMQKRKILDDKIAWDGIKGKTKAEKITNALKDNPDLLPIYNDIEALEQELVMTADLDKGYTEMINAFKRELTRREKEYQYVRDERRLT